MPCVLPSGMNVAVSSENTCSFSAHTMHTKGERNGIYVSAFKAKDDGRVGGGGGGV